MNHIEILEALDKEFGQKEIYMWSTYILPNGHFLNPENGSDFHDDQTSIDYEHSDFDYWVSDNFGFEGLETLDKYCIKMNVTYPYLHLPEARITPEQIKAIRKIIDHRREFEYANEDIAFSADNMSALDMEEPLMVSYDRSVAIFDLAIYNADDILKSIGQVYYLGKFIFESSANGKVTYKDQDGTEIYDLYDMRHHEQLPLIIEDSEIIDNSDPYRLQVFIDYPTVSGMFSLAGDIGRSYFDAEAGKKAFVRNNIYRHPEKGWSSRITLWHPLTYIEECLLSFQRRGSNVKTVEELIESRVVDYDLEGVFKPLEGQIFYPSIDYRDDSQEGLHRAVYALMKGIDYIPVIVIK